MTKGPAEIAHGPMLIGLGLNVLLYGIMISQVYLYYVTYKNDRTWMKLFVALLLFADTINTVFDFTYIYTSLIPHFGDIAYLGKANWIFATDPALTGIIAGLVQTFFAWRVKVLTGSTGILVVVLIATIAGACGGIATAVEVGFTPDFVSFRNFKSVVCLWLAAECFGDILITAIMKKHKTGFEASDQLIDRIIRLTMQTGLLTSVCALLDLAFFLCDPTGTHLIFNFPLSKLYTNSLMSSLNSRGGWNFGGTNGTAAAGASGNASANNSNGRLDGSQGIYSSERISNKSKPGSRSRSSRSDPGVFVHVDVESHEMHDTGDALTYNVKPEMLRDVSSGRSSLDMALSGV